MNAYHYNSKKHPCCFQFLQRPPLLTFWPQGHTLSVNIILESSKTIFISSLFVLYTRIEEWCIEIHLNEQAVLRHMKCRSPRKLSNRRPPYYQTTNSLPCYILTTGRFEHMKCVTCGTEAWNKATINVLCLLSQILKSTWT